jgi:hypothetical protein
VGLDLGLCLQGHTKWVGDFSTFVGVYKDGKGYGVFLVDCRGTLFLYKKG